MSAEYLRTPSPIWQNKELSFTSDLVFSVLHPDTILVGDKAAMYYISWTSDGHYLRAQSQGHPPVDSLEKRCGRRKWWTIFFERTLELFQRQCWGNFWEKAWSTCGLTWALVNSLLLDLICCIIIRWNDGERLDYYLQLQGHRVQIFTKTSLSCIFWNMGRSTCGLSFLHSPQTWCDWVITRQIDIGRVHITQHGQVLRVWILTKCPWHTFWTAEPFTAHMVCWYISSGGWAVERLGCYSQLGQCHRFESRPKLGILQAESHVRSQVCCLRGQC